MPNLDDRFLVRLDYFAMLHQPKDRLVLETGVLHITLGYVRREVSAVLLDESSLSNDDRYAQGVPGGSRAEAQIDCDQV